MFKIIILIVLLIWNSSVLYEYHTHRSLLKTFLNFKKICILMIITFAFDIALIIFRDYFFIINMPPLIKWFGIIIMVVANVILLFKSDLKIKFRALNLAYIGFFLAVPKIISIILALVSNYYLTVFVIENNINNNIK